MKIFLATILTLASAPLFGPSARAAGPDLLAEPMVDLAGKTASLADFRGEVLVVNFWASWCAPCRDELPVLDAWNTGWSGTGARVVAVSLDKKIGNVERFVADTGVDLSVLIDGPDGLAVELDLAAVPSTYLLDRDGRVVMVVQGYKEDELLRLKKAAEDLLKPATKGGNA
jgi:thiol-disulfide isomerase/thioredoxin